MEYRYTVLFTHQKTKKSKTWQDGKLRVTDNRKIELYDDHNNKLENVYCKVDQIRVGEPIESDRHLITIEEEQGPGRNDGQKSLPAVQNSQVKQTHARNPLRSKRMGFTVPRPASQPTATEQNTNVPTKEKGVFSTPLNSKENNIFHVTQPLQNDLPQRTPFLSLYGQAHNKAQDQSSIQVNIVGHDNGTCTSQNGPSCDSEEHKSSSQTLQVVHSDMKPGGKRSASQILALLSRRRGCFQPPLKKTKLDSDVDTDSHFPAHSQTSFSLGVEQCSGLALIPPARGGDDGRGDSDHVMAGERQGASQRQQSSRTTPQGMFVKGPHKSDDGNENIRTSGGEAQQEPFKGEFVLDQQVTTGVHLPACLEPRTSPGRTHPDAEDHESSRCVEAAGYAGCGVGESMEWEPVCDGQTTGEARQEPYNREYRDTGDSDGDVNDTRNKHHGKYERDDGDDDDDGTLSALLDLTEVELASKGGNNNSPGESSKNLGEFCMDSQLTFDDAGEGFSATHSSNQRDFEPKHGCSGAGVIVEASQIPADSVARMIGMDTEGNNIEDGNSFDQTGTSLMVEQTVGDIGLFSPIHSKRHAHTGDEVIAEASQLLAKPVNLMSDMGAGASTEGPGQTESQLPVELVNVVRDRNGASSAGEGPGQTESSHIVKETADGMIGLSSPVQQGVIGQGVSDDGITDGESPLPIELVNVVRDRNGASSTEEGPGQTESPHIVKEIADDMIGFTSTVQGEMERHGVNDDEIIDGESRLPVEPCDVMLNTNAAASTEGKDSHQETSVGLTPFVHCGTDEHDMKDDGIIVEESHFILATASADIMMDMDTEAADKDEDRHEGTGSLHPIDRTADDTGLAPPAQCDRGQPVIEDDKVIDGDSQFPIDLGNPMAGMDTGNTPSSEDIHGQISSRRDHIEDGMVRGNVNKVQSQGVDLNEMDESFSQFIELCWNSPPELVEAAAVKTAPDDTHNSPETVQLVCNTTKETFTEEVDYCGDVSNHAYLLEHPGVDSLLESTMVVLGESQSAASWEAQKGNDAGKRSDHSAKGNHSISDGAVSKHNVIGGDSNVQTDISCDEKNWPAHDNIHSRDVCKKAESESKDDTPCDDCDDPASNPDNSGDTPSGVGDDEKEEKSSDKSLQDADPCMVEDMETFEHSLNGTVSHERTSVTTPPNEESCEEFESIDTQACNLELPNLISVEKNEQQEDSSVPKPTQEPPHKLYSTSVNPRTECASDEADVREMRNDLPEVPEFSHNGDASSDVTNNNSQASILSITSVDTLDLSLSSSHQDTGQMTCNSDNCSEVVQGTEEPLNYEDLLTGNHQVKEIGACLAGQLEHSFIRVGGYSPLQQRSLGGDSADRHHDAGDEADRHLGNAGHGIIETTAVTREYTALSSQMHHEEALSHQQERAVQNVTGRTEDRSKQNGDYSHGTGEHLSSPVTLGGTCYQLSPLQHNQRGSGSSQRGLIDDVMGIPADMENQNEDHLSWASHRGPVTSTGPLSKSPDRDVLRPMVYSYTEGPNRGPYLAGDETTGAADYKDQQHGGNSLYKDLINALPPGNNIDPPHGTDLHSKHNRRTHYWLKPLTSNRVSRKAPSPTVTFASASRDQHLHVLPTYTANSPMNDRYSSLGGYDSVFVDDQSPYHHSSQTSDRFATQGAAFIPQTPTVTPVAGYDSTLVDDQSPYRLIGSGDTPNSQKAEPIQHPPSVTPIVGFDPSLVDHRSPYHHLLEASDTSNTHRAAPVRHPPFVTPIVGFEPSPVDDHQLPYHHLLDASDTPNTHRPAPIQHPPSVTPIAGFDSSLVDHHRSPYHHMLDTSDTPCTHRATFIQQPPSLQHGSMHSPSSTGSPVIPFIADNQPPESLPPLPHENARIRSHKFPHIPSQVCMSTQYAHASRVHSLLSARDKLNWCNLEGRLPYSELPLYRYLDQAVIGSSDHPSLCRHTPVHAQPDRYLDNDVMTSPDIVHGNDTESETLSSLHPQNKSCKNQVVIRELATSALSPMDRARYRSSPINHRSQQLCLEQDNSSLISPDEVNLQLLPSRLHCVPSSSQESAMELPVTPLPQDEGCDPDIFINGRPQHVPLSSQLSNAIRGELDMNSWEVDEGILQSDQDVDKAGQQERTEQAVPDVCDTASVISEEDFDSQMDLFPTQIEEGKKTPVRDTREEVESAGMTWKEKLIFTPLISVATENFPASQMFRSNETSVESVKEQTTGFTEGSKEFCMALHQPDTFSTAYHLDATPEAGSRALANSDQHQGKSDSRNLSSSTVPELSRTQQLVGVRGPSLLCGMPPPQSEVLPWNNDSPCHEQRVPRGAADEPQGLPQRWDQQDRHTPCMRLVEDGAPHQVYGRSGQTYQEPRMSSAQRSETPHSRTAVRSFQTPVVAKLVHDVDEKNICHDLVFMSITDVSKATVPQRQIQIPVTFSDATSYKQTLAAVLREHINIILYEVAYNFFSALSKVDVSSYSPFNTLGGGVENPPCQHKHPSKRVCVKKDGPNKGRFFYACSKPRGSQCKFFQWADQGPAKAGNQLSSKEVLNDSRSIEMYLKSFGISIYCECQLLRKNTFRDNLPGAPAWIKKYRQNQLNNERKKLYLKLSRKEVSSVYGKDDLWVLSRDLSFGPSDTFLARSVFHGPNAVSELEIEPLTGYSPSNWPSQGTVHAIHACNVSTELSCLANLQEFVNPQTLPLLPALLSRDPTNSSTIQRSQNSFKSPALATGNTKQLCCSNQQILELAGAVITEYHLNADQGRALTNVASMFLIGPVNQTSPITLIHGVFGAGKSYLLSVTVLFLVQLFQLHQQNGGDPKDWKVLIASTTNVAVDRILLNLLNLGFEEFIRVGSIRKIAKPVLPYSAHASDKANQELKELQEMLKGDLSPKDKNFVRKCIERQRLGINKAMLANVLAVGVTCAACAFPCISNLKFPVVLLDECSQITEPACLLPVARFGCNKLVLVGDPNQLDPTVQGSEASNQYNLEQTLFDRLLLMGHEPTLLRTQYRCHPDISAIANQLFYDNGLLDGVAREDRKQLAEGFPTVCFYNVAYGKECRTTGGSYLNDKEAEFVVTMIEMLLVQGLQQSQIGVITLYKAQVAHITTLVQQSGLAGAKELKAIQISTVDAFQGGEKDVIILSCVRSDFMGFAASDKRTNVALTRSRHHLLIVGNQRILAADSLWRRVLAKCREYPEGMKNSMALLKEWTTVLEEEKQKRKAKKSKKLKAPAVAEMKVTSETAAGNYSPQLSLESYNGEGDVSPEAGSPVMSMQSTGESRDGMGSLQRVAVSSQDKGAVHIVPVKGAVSHTSDQCMGVNTPTHNPHGTTGTRLRTGTAERNSDLVVTSINSLPTEVTGGVGTSGGETPMDESSDVRTPSGQSNSPSYSPLEELSDSGDELPSFSLDVDF